MNLIATLADLLRPVSPPSAATRKALQRLCSTVEPLLKNLPGLESKLQEPLAGALDYCDRLVGSMRPPLSIDRHAFASDPLVHSLFATADDIEQMLGRSQSIRDYLGKPSTADSESIFAMLAARRQVKKTLGVALEGEMVRGDVPMEYLFFSDHTLAEPGATLEENTELLRMVAFDSLLKSFHSQLVILRQEHQALRDKREAERDRASIVRTQATGQALEEHSRRLADLDARLQQSADALQLESIADRLADFLRAPEKALRLEPVSITVDRAGVVRTADQTEAVGIDTLHFQQIIGRDRRQYLVLRVKICRQEAQEAVEIVRDRQQRYLII